MFRSTILSPAVLYVIYIIYYPHKCWQPLGSWRDGWCGTRLRCHLMSAIFFCISWFFLCPDIMYLSRVYCRAAWKQNSVAPRAPKAVPYRALFRQPKGPWSQQNNKIKVRYRTCGSCCIITFGFIGVEIDDAPTARPETWGQQVLLRYFNFIH